MAWSPIKSLSEITTWVAYCHTASQNWWRVTCDLCAKLRSLLEALWTLSALLGFVLLMYWLVFDMEAPLQAGGGTALTPRVVVGGQLKVKWEFDLHAPQYSYWPFRRECSYTVHRYVSGCGLYSVETIEGVTPEHIVSVRLPDTIPDGSICNYQTRVDYACNPLQKLLGAHVDFPPVPFLVVGRHE